MPGHQSQVWTRARAARTSQLWIGYFLVSSSAQRCTGRGPHRNPGSGLQNSNQHIEIDAYPDVSDRRTGKIDRRITNVSDRPMPIQMYPIDI